LATTAQPDAKADRRPLRVWDVKTGKPIHSFDVPPASLLAWCPDGKTLALGGSGEGAQVVDAQTGKVLRTLPGTGGATGMAYRKDGRLLALVGGWGGVNIPPPGTLGLWRPDPGERVAQSIGPSTEINAVAFPPDGTRVATAGSDRAVWLWDVVPLAAKE